MTMKLSKYFSLSEFTKSQTASRKGIDNTPSETHIDNMKLLCENVLDYVREDNGPVIVTSGYRSPELCEAIGSSKNSQHAKGEAADIECLKLSNGELAELISSECTFDQLILEFHTKGDSKSGWVHVSYKETDNRGQRLIAKRVNGKTVYEEVEDYSDFV